MSTIKGNAEALKAHKDDSLVKTRFELECALSRLRNGNPKVVAKGKKITASSVAKEAGIDRSTLYRYHEPIVTEIRKLNDATPISQVKQKRTELANEREKSKEYRGLLEEAQVDLKLIALQNYALEERNKELENLLRLRDDMIKELQLQVNRKSFTPIRGAS